MGRCTVSRDRTINADVGTPRTHTRERGRPDVAHLCAPACYAVVKNTRSRVAMFASSARPRTRALFASAAP
eukprot:2893396-Prymnesium_polylepis.1